MAERRSGSLRIVVLGHIVRGPVGGMAWHHLQYVLGLVRLGHDAWFIEDSQDYPACYDPDRDVVSTDASYGLRFAQETFELVGLDDRWAYYDAHQDSWHGPAGTRGRELCETADVLLHMSGKSPLRPWMHGIPHRVLIDTDPAFTQIRHLEDEQAMASARMHTAHLTFAGNANASLPDDGLSWQATRQPVVLDAWSVVPASPESRLTTVMLWDSYAPKLHAGVEYGMKSLSFRPYMDLPARSQREIELAVGSPHTPKQELRERGFVLSSPLDVTRSAQGYQRYIQGSRAEFSVAKHGYVVSRSGWFSERSAAYLASGRPVVVQDTGFRTWMSEDRGVLSFSDPESAALALEDLEARYEEHAGAARDVAARYFDANVVLSELLEAAMVGGDTR